MKKFVFGYHNDFEGTTELKVIEGINALDAMIKFASTEEWKADFESLEDAYNYFSEEFQISNIMELKGELIEV